MAEFMLLTHDVKRLSIFAYYDAEGIVDDSVLYLLKALRAECTAQIVVVNGTLTPDSEARVREYCTSLLYRENKGFDITAYREGLLSVRAELADYDEILFYNQTIFGPVYPVSEMFDIMARRDVDFWGLTRHKGARVASWDNAVSIAPHVQSFFFAVRKTMFTDARFLEYWENLPPIETYWDAVGKHEVLFTEKFAALGFTWDVYVHTEALELYNDYPLMGMPAGLLADCRCPFFKRKSFLCSRQEYTNVPQGEATQTLYDFVRTQTEYPAEIMTQSLLRTTDITTLTNALTLYYDTSVQKTMADGIALVLWVASEALADTLCAAPTMQKNDHVFCLFANEQLHEKYAPLLYADAECITISENGAQYLFTTLWPKLQKYTYVLYLNNALPLLLGEFFDATTMNTSIESLAGQSCGALLEEHGDIGVLLPPPPTHQECGSFAIHWPQIAPTIKEALHTAGIDVPLGETHPGTASRGGMFFARIDAIAPLANYPFTEACFAGLYPAWEYLVPLAAQSKGYFTARACTPLTAYTLLANQNAMLQEIDALWTTPDKMRYDQMLFRMRAILDFYHERRYKMTMEQAFEADLTFKQKMWICAQILLKPETFAWLHAKLTKENSAPLPAQTDELD
ncbi:MAG: rhamnan synthesis F family protein [Ruthenibacterium sp.]